MADNSEENEKLSETVTLILKKERFEVGKKKLISKSQYFAVLLSENYLEHRQTEHNVNYNISSSSLKDFINWIHNDEIAINYNEMKEFDRLLILLELGVLFAAGNLIKDVTDRLERHFMSPNYVIKIWLLAQKLNINVLRDLSLAVCLERFDELPFKSICEDLSRGNFLKLIGNINIKSTKKYYLHRLRREWMNHHCDSTIPLDILKKKNRKENILHSIISCESSDVINSEQFIHCWDGNDFFELTSFKYPKDITDRSTGKHILTGMQITGREYNLYLCGGEFGIGSGKFNKNVWRYSLISKKWYLETVMPFERRDMIAVFLKHKLVLVGGVGQFRRMSLNVDIYDTYTGLWRSGADMPWYFKTVPEYYVFDDKLIICRSYNSYSLDVCIYYPDQDTWKIKTSEETSFNKLCLLTINMPLLSNTSSYIDIKNPDKMILRTVTETCNKKNCNHALVEKRHIKLKEDLHYIKNKSRIYTYYGIEDHSEYKYIHVEDFFSAIYCKFYCGNSIILISTNFKTPLHLHSIPIRNQNKFRSLLFCHSHKRFFNLINPAHLHATNLKS